MIEELCIQCKTKPVDGKSRYCSPECHSHYVQGQGSQCGGQLHPASLAEAEAYLASLIVSVNEPIGKDGKMSSSKIPPYHIIPAIAIERLAMRYGYGEETKKDKAWNSTTDNQDCLLDKAILIRRLGHTIGHCYSLINKVIKGLPLYDLPKDDDAAAIMWGGSFSIAATDAMDAERHKPTP